MPSSINRKTDGFEDVTQHQRGSKRWKASTQKLLDAGLFNLCSILRQIPFDKAADTAWHEQLGSKLLS